jgi:hypothetical protein
MANQRVSIEKNFRRGSNGFLLIAILSAACSTALYQGFGFQMIRAFCLATPMVLEAVARSVDPRYFGSELRYYCWVFSLAVAGLVASLGLLSRYASHAGVVLKLSNLFKGFARFGNFLGIAHLVGARLFYFVGVVLYTLDGVGAIFLENLVSWHLKDLKLIVMMNLGFHFVMLAYLLYGFVAGFEKSEN